MRVIESEGNINRHPFDMPVCVSIIASSITPFAVVDDLIITPPDNPNYAIVQTQ